MYNKLFTKILDSSIWLEPTATRIVWLTMLAAMDESGFVQFASVPNLAHRARLTIPETEEAVKCLEAPDTNSSDPEHEGRRVERVPGGWMILNAGKYRAMVNRAVIQEQTRERVRKHREKKAGNAKVTKCNDEVTPSEADTDTHSAAGSKARESGYAVPQCFALVDGFSAALAGWIEMRKKIKKPPTGRAIQLMIDKLKERPGMAVRALDMATGASWQGFEWKWLDERAPESKTIRENIKVPIIKAV